MLTGGGNWRGVAPPGPVEGCEVGVVLELVAAAVPVRVGVVGATDGEVAGLVLGAGEASSIGLIVVAVVVEAELVAAAIEVRMVVGAGTAVAAGLATAATTVIDVVVVDDDVVTPVTGVVVVGPTARAFPTGPCGEGGLVAVRGAAEVRRKLRDVCCPSACFPFG